MGAHQALEHAEHTTHAGGGHGDGHVGGDHKSVGKKLGLTMALIAVLIAFCAAMVGSERNELTKAMILQTQANSNYTSASTKFRLIMLDIEKLRASPSFSAPITTPEGQVRKRLIRLYVDYAKERELSKSWSDSYEPMVEAHFEAAEGYEHAQLVAEIGVVLASLAVLLSSQPAWILSMLLAFGAVGRIGLTYFKTSRTAHDAELHVKEKEEAYAELRKAHAAANEDEATIEAIDPGGKIRAEISAKSGAGEKSEKKEEKKE